MSRRNVAGSNITDLVGVMPRQQFNLGGLGVLSVPELPGASLTSNILAGEMVCLSGLVAGGKGVCRPGVDASGYGILGFAADNASGITSGFIGVWPCTPETVFVGNIGHSVTSALAQTAAIDLYQKFGLTSLSGRTYVDKAKVGTTSTAMVRVIELYGQDTHPCFYGRVAFVVFPGVCQLTSLYQMSDSGPTATVI